MPRKPYRKCEQPTVFGKGKRWQDVSVFIDDKEYYGLFEARNGTYVYFDWKDEGSWYKILVTDLIPRESKSLFKEFTLVK